MIWRKQLFFVSMLLPLTLLILEGATRVVLPFIIPEHSVPDSVGQFDEMLGWSLKPLSSGTSSRTGYEISYRINSKGLRDDETSYKKPSGVFRILLLGDSNTFGFGVPVEKHFSMLLEGYFNNVEIINMGVSGFGVDQQLLFLRLEGFKYQPDLVIAYVPHYGGHRHMHTKRFGKEKPRFLLVEGELRLSNSPVKDPCVLAGAAFGELNCWLVEHSKAYRGFSSVLSRIITREKATDDQDKTNEKNKVFRDKLYELGENLVYAMHEESLRHGAKFALVTKINDLHKKALIKGMLSLSVTKPLSNKRFDLPANLAHLNEPGNGVLAWEMAEFLRRNHLIPVEHLTDD